MTMKEIMELIKEKDLEVEFIIKVDFEEEDLENGE